MNNKSTPVKRLGAHLIDTIVTFFIVLLILGIAGAKQEGFGIVLLLAFLCPLIVQFYFWRKSTSLGKQILKMRVVKKNSGQPLTFVEMLLRELIGKYISGLVLSLGYIWILIDADNQGWHDKFVGSVVVDC